MLKYMEFTAKTEDEAIAKGDAAVQAKLDTLN